MNLYTLITGASSGIGRAIAQRLSVSRSLILCGRNIERLHETQNLCAESSRHIIWTYDLSNVNDVLNELGGFLHKVQALVECFVHCAGVVKVLPLRQMDCATVMEIMNINCLSAIQIIRVLLTKAGNKSALKNILFISSTSGIRGVKGMAIYSASKGGLDAMMKSLAVELAPSVRVNSIAPGAIRTANMEHIFAGSVPFEKMKNKYLLGLGEVEDIASIAEFLVSDKARWITGQCLIVDGGQTAH